MDALDRLPSVHADAPAVHADDPADAGSIDASSILDELMDPSAGPACAVDGLDAVPADRPQRRRLSMFEGDLNGGRAHMNYIRSCKRIRQAQRQSDALRSEHRAIDDAWNGQRLRNGDFVGEDDRDQGTPHPNKYCSKGVIVNAYKQIGAQKTLRAGIDGLPMELAALAAVSSAFDIAQDEWVRSNVEQIRFGKRSCYFRKFYDATPRPIEFGRLQPLLMPQARYAWSNGLKWEMLRLEEYQARCKCQKILRKGTLDVLASSVDCVTMTPDNALDGFRVLVRPQILAAANSSCVYDATEQSVPAFSSEGVRELCRHVPFCIGGEQPDACGVNGRKQSKTIEDLSDVKNFLHARGKCGAHQCQRVIATTERASCGDVHAVQVSCGHPGHASAMQMVLKDIIKEVVVHVGAPPAACTRRNEAVVKRTLLRRAEYIAQDPFVDSPFFDRQPERESAVKKFVSLWNGDWGSPLVEHWCHAGCVHGNEPGELQDAMYGAAVEVDILVSDEKEPSLDEWGSCGQTCGKIACGILCHNVLPRAHPLALPTWSSMQPADVGAAVAADRVDAMRIRVQKKSWRCSKVLHDQARRQKVCLLAWNTCPVERLGSELQYPAVVISWVVVRRFSDFQLPPNSSK